MLADDRWDFFPRGKSGHQTTAYHVEHMGGDDISYHRRKVSQKINHRGGNFSVRVKRRSKSPPLQAQVRRHDKPYAVQDKQENRQSAWMLSPVLSETPGISH